MNGIGLNPRIAALKTLDAVMKKGQRLEKSFYLMVSQNSLNSQELAFAKNLTLTTIRRWGQIDNLIERCLFHPSGKKFEKTRTIIRIGVCQLLFLRTKDHAAISTTMELAQVSGCRTHKKVINAVLRRLQREGSKLMENQDAEKLNTPSWLWNSWKKCYGVDKTRDIARVHMTEPPLDLSYKNEPGEELVHLNGVLLPWGTARCKVSGEISKLSGFKEGLWWVQDSASRIAVQLFGDVRGKRVIDMCAAPGGKTLFLASAGAHVVAVDKSEKRLKLLTENLKRLNLEAEIILANSLFWRPKSLVDYVLLDAPCSATGIIRRHPDVAYLKNSQDVEKLVVMQSKLLDSATKMINESGVILFCTCSLQYEEGPGQIEAFLGRYPDFILDKVSGAELFQAESHTGMFRSLPCDYDDVGGCDGFFAARLKRK